MLIIAIPKSASTSLMVTLGHLHSCDVRQIGYREMAIPSELNLLFRYHSDLREIGNEHVEQFDDPQVFYKQHIPPTHNNTNLLKETRKVILLRRPDEILESYFRAEKRNLHKPRPEFAGCDTLADWKTRAHENGLHQDLEWFYDEWQDAASKNQEHDLIISFDDLVMSPDETVNRIETHLGLSTSTQVNLSKERYSRHTYLFYKIQYAKKLLKRFRRWLL